MKTMKINNEIIAENEEKILAIAAERGIKLLSAIVNGRTKRIEQITFACPICKTPRAISPQQLHQVQYCDTCTRKNREQRKYNLKNEKFIKEFK